MKLKRSAGVLLHITSLPGKQACGSLGDEAYEFVDLLKKGGFSYWQILPIGPVSPSMQWSPYSSLSSFAGNELFINVDYLKKEKWFVSDFVKEEVTDDHFADFFWSRDYIRRAIIQSYNDFIFHGTDDDKREFNSFCKKQDFWLDDYSLFMALAHEFNSFNWLEWDKRIALREGEFLSFYKVKLEKRIDIIKYSQFVFFRQWEKFKNYANSQGISIIGDIPIYVSMDSADAWSMSSILEIDKENLRPTYVAGVPPDYFSETGQLWGNPVYKWYIGDKLNEETYSWWKKRICHNLQFVDVIRIDHFRGFESFWKVKYGEKTAINGHWEKAPGEEFFYRLKDEIGDLPFIAEDLGVITPEVKALRDSFELPGMKILQFAFGSDDKNDYLPHNIDNRNCLVYTGTHDNDTINGWFYDPLFPEEDRAKVMEYLAMKEWSDFHKRIIREAYATLADLVVIPAQDILGYGREFRMNTPGTIEGNWKWKLTSGAFNEDLMKPMRRLAKLFSRLQWSDENI
ncbi:MAG TPA: 4-alpha-glucanotransferase [Spirochaetota bacterium]|nr:4-alpha-glucanotransferase [Spirochaetota bacterium]HRU66339.1 4-alpha-glucanotransferase [Spirochaetota bacterium]